MDIKSLRRTTRSFKDYTCGSTRSTNITSLDIPDVELLRPQRFRDARGVFCEIYNRQSLSLRGISVDFVQDNCSVSQAACTIRGLHFQAPPMAQAKLVMVLRGRVRDVAVDCRKGSPTYGNHIGVELDGDNWHQLFVPEGFAHGFCTLSQIRSYCTKCPRPTHRSWTAASCGTIRTSVSTGRWRQTRRLFRTRTSNCSGCVTSRLPSAMR